MIKKESRNSMRLVRHSRIRKQVSGTSNIPRLCVYRSNLNISAQLIDDENRVTLASASSKNYKGNNIEVAKLVGEKIAEEANKDESGQPKKNNDPLSSLFGTGPKKGGNSGNKGMF